MIFGFNTEILYKNRKYHIQSEDRGVNHPVIETLVYNKGAIVFSTKQNYGHLLEKKDLGKRVKNMLEKQHNDVIANIKAGKYDTLFGIEETQEIKLEKKLEEETLGGEKEKKKEQVEDNKVEQVEDNKVLNQIKKHINNLTDTEIFYNIHFPIVEYDEDKKALLLSCRITIYRTKKPLINTPVEIILQDKKKNIISSLETRTNYYGGFKSQILSDQKPYWIKITIKSKDNENQLTALFYAR